MYPALQQKAIDGVELVYNNIPAGRFYEVLKYANETGHIMLINFEVISAKYFNSLPADYQKILVEECDKAGLETSKKILASEQEVKKQLIAKGMVAVEDCRYCRLQEGRREGLRGPEDHRCEEQGLQGNGQEVGLQAKRFMISGPVSPTELERPGRTMRASAGPIVSRLSYPTKVDDEKILRVHLQAGDANRQILIGDSFIIGICCGGSANSALSLELGDGCGNISFCLDGFSGRRCRDAIG